MQIVENSEELCSHLETASNAIKSQDEDSLVKGCIGLADILFDIHPFEPKLPTDWTEDTWHAILEAWICGATLFRVTDSKGIAFVQQALVYQFVWAIEAARIILENPEEDEDFGEEQTKDLALCMTYGVPNIPSARLLEYGLESRVLAVRLVAELDLQFTKKRELESWLDQQGEEDPIKFTDQELQAWRSFLAKNNRKYESWTRHEIVGQFNGESIPPVGSRVRLKKNSSGIIDVYSPEFVRLGDCVADVESVSTVPATVMDDNSLSIKNFRPIAVPSWMLPFLENPID